MNVKKILSAAVTPPSFYYELILGENLIEQALSWVKSHEFRPILITTVALQGLLPKLKVDKIVLPHGESIKSRAMKEKIEDALIEKGCGRSTCLIAIGGGVLIDLVGFVASTYCRGISYISIPSTLLAMTDAAIGGKTGINVAKAKNWIGAFHQPQRVYIDFTLLRTLPQNDYTYGFAETIKHSLIADPDLFQFLEENHSALILREPSLLKEMVWRSCQIKLQIVEQDPFETKGLRRILNFGHTIGHALETLSNYELPHGQAVLLGMLVEAAIAQQLGYLSSSAFTRIHKFFEQFPIILDYPAALPYEIMTRDKKGAHRLVMLTDIGSVASFEGEYVTHLTEEVFHAGWNAVVRHN